LGEGVLAEAPGAEADALAEGADPLRAAVAMRKVLLVVGLQAEGAELPRANVLRPCLGIIL